jgi:hypothetical protein
MGGNKPAEEAERAAGSAGASSSAWDTVASSLYKKGEGAVDPILDRLNKLMKGDSTTVLQTVAPTLQASAVGFNKAKAGAMETSNPYLRDAMTGSLDAGRNISTAETIGKAIWGAPTEMANIAGTLFGAGGTAAGAGVGYKSQEMAGLNTAAEAASASKAAWLGLAGDVAKAGGTVAGGKLAGKSDGRLKRRVTRIEHPLDIIQKMRGVFYYWDKTKLDTKDMPDSREVGVIAQEVQAVLPEVIEETFDGYLAVDYGKLSAVLIEAVKEQQTQIGQLQQEVESMKNKVEVFA